MRNYGTHGGRPSLGGLSTEAPASRNAILPRDSLLSSSPPFERSEIKQALLDVLCVGFAFLYVSVAGVGLAFSFFVAFFVGL